MVGMARMTPMIASVSKTGGPRFVRLRGNGSETLCVTKGGSMSRWGLMCASALMALSAGGVAWAQEAYPTRPITVIVPYGPGSSTDIMSRATRLHRDFVHTRPPGIFPRPGCEFETAGFSTLASGNHPTPFFKAGSASRATPARRPAADRKGCTSVRAASDSDHDRPRNHPSMRDCVRPKHTPVGVLASAGFVAWLPVKPASALALRDAWRGRA